MQQTTDQDPVSVSLWQALRLYNLYRVILAFGFFAIIHLHIQVNFFGHLDETLYNYASTIYLLTSFFFLICSLLFKQYYQSQTTLSIFVDIVAIVIIMHASGGFISGVGILLIVIVAAHSLLVPGRISLLIGALAVIGIFIEHTYSFLAQQLPSNTYTQVGLLGAVILATSFVTNLLSIRVRKSQIMVENQSRLLAASQQLNAHIVSAMHEGVLVLDNHQQIRLMNTATKKLLGLPNNITLKELKDLPSAFQHIFQGIQPKINIPLQPLTAADPDIRISLHPLGKGLPTGTLVFIHDASEDNRHAQELKLASLGHLTANIAHELRNPLGTASHAAQLLAESTTLSEEENILLKMIKQSCDRMNTVIKNVLSLSSRTPVKTQHIALIPWLKQFIQDLVIATISEPSVMLEYQQEDLFIDIDPSQLTQILINLCENGLRHSLQRSGKASIILRISVEDTSSQAIYLDVIDQGKGIPSHLVKHIFEPFFTTEKSGSGLGLYIAKELSQMNGARLEYCPTQEGCQFRITLGQGEQTA